MLKAARNPFDMTTATRLASTGAGIKSILETKVDNSRVLTDVPANAVFTDTVYAKPTSEPISYITGLQAKLDAKAEKPGVSFSGSLSIVSSVDFDTSTAETVTININNGIIVSIR
jgi:hypothetical protein